MTELIASVILISSIIGMGIIIYRKIPVLVELPEIAEKSILADLWQKLKEKIKNLSPLKSFSSEIFIQKILSKIRILILRMENKISHWLERLRQGSLKKKNNLSENYWQELKKPKDKEGKNSPE